MSQHELAERSAGGILQGEQEKIPPYAWVILAVAFIASVAAPLNQFKASPVIPVLMEVFGFSLGRAGLLMSVFAITGLVLALPAGLITQRLGLKPTALIATGCLVVGSSLGALSSSAAVMLFSRVIEGVGMGLLAVVAPAAIAMWFPRSRQGTPMGIWATWVPVGGILSFVVAPPMAAAFGWQSVWWFGAAFALAALVLVLFFMRMPPRLQSAGAPEEAAAPEAHPVRSALANRDIWLLALTFGMFNLATMPMNTYYPTFLTSVRGYSLAGASLVTSLTMMTVLIFAPLSGVLSDRIGSRKALFSWPFLVIAAFMLLPYNVTGWGIPLTAVLLGVIAGAIPTATFSATPALMRRPEQAGLGLAVVSLGQNLGMFIGPILFGMAAESVGWAPAAYAMIPFLLAGLVSARLVRIR